MHIGNCHCGAVTLTIPGVPNYVNVCNCTLCSKIAGAWGYFTPDDVHVRGLTTAYCRADMIPPNIATHHCPRCGCSTHWSPVSAQAAGRMGVNMRLFEDGLMAGIEVRKIDGRSW